jgi:hypothetical protein
MACCHALAYLVGLIVRPVRRLFAPTDDMADAPACE